MNIKYENFIGIYSNVYPINYCQHVITEFERLSEEGCGYNRKTSEKIGSHIKSDYSINLDLASIYNIHINLFEDQPVKNIFFHGLQKCFDSYKSEYSTLEYDKLRTLNFKVQKTKPGEGYHVWHSEHGPSVESLPRVLTFILYLNSLNVNDGGETEFLYLRKRYTPLENTLMIWPASFTHTHRGNTVLGNINKYVATGWFSFEG